MRRTLGAPRIRALRLLPALAGLVASAALAAGSAGGVRDDPLAPALAAGVPILCGGGHGPYFALTFDDGPGPVTPRLLALLQSTRTPATFFLVGAHAVAYPGYTRQLAALGALGDHSWDHPQLSKLAPQQITTELRRAQRAIGRVAHQRVQLFRPPFGENEPILAATAQRLKMVDILWNVDVGDWRAPTPDPQATAAALVAKVRPGAIVLLHDNIPATVDALALALPQLLAKGLIPVTIPQLLSQDPPDLSRQQLGPGVCHSYWHPS